MNISKEVLEIIQKAIDYAINNKYEYVTPETLLYCICDNSIFQEAFEICGGDIDGLKTDLEDYFLRYIEKGKKANADFSTAANQVLAFSGQCALSSGNDEIKLRHLIHAIFALKQSYAVYYINKQEVTEADLQGEMSDLEEEEEYQKNAGSERGKKNKYEDMNSVFSEEDDEFDDEDDYLEDEADDEDDEDEEDNDDEDYVNENEAGKDDYDEHEKDGNSFRRRYDNQVGKFYVYPGSGSSDGKEYASEYHDGSSDDKKGPDNKQSKGVRNGKKSSDGKKSWELYAPCLNDSVDDANPLIGREAELERTIQILCRKDKNNPLHIGEPGVGKTAITYGLVRMINEGRIPSILKGSKVFALDMAGMLAGTQYRGDFEKRFKKVLGEIEKEEKPIVYLDEIHNILGAGAVGEGSFDAANMLKSYLSDGHIRFIGATTFEEYKKYFEKSKSLVRRFQNVEIKEPTEQETVEILQGLKEKYEEFHGVIYADGVLEYAVSMSAKHINERFLPDKAIDLIDEAGAYRKLHLLPNDKNASDPENDVKVKKKSETDGGSTSGKLADFKGDYVEKRSFGSKESDVIKKTTSFDNGTIEDWQRTVTKEDINTVLTKICRVPIETVETDDISGLSTLEQRIKAKIFGQDEAVMQVVNAVKFSKAGLLEDNKPLASLLFVGPTGVGKTEVARTLADELGVKLIRFDMSEYEEKHAVAKLIGAPAGYVGYEEGGQLTEAVRKNPSAVLLLDEIEKAHPDIYNVLLQVMDYATLTDNQGRKADFRNIVFIMTSNAGANRLGKKEIGFGSESMNESVISEEVKRTFQPEFRNRLNRIVVFKSMDEKMAMNIVNKKLGEFSEMLQKKNIILKIDEKAKKLIKDRGISEEFGAREIDRIIRNEVKPLFVDEILFGKLKNGGSSELTAMDGKFIVSGT